MDNENNYGKEHLSCAQKRKIVFTVVIFILASVSCFLLDGEEWCWEIRCIFVLNLFVLVIHLIVIVYNIPRKHNVISTYFCFLIGIIAGGLMFDLLGKTNECSKRIGVFLIFTPILWLLHFLYYWTEAEKSMEEKTDAETNAHIGEKKDADTDQKQQANMK